MTWAHFIDLLRALGPYAAVLITASHSMATRRQINRHQSQRQIHHGRDHRR